jgi:acyl carrier protein
MSEILNENAELTTVAKLREWVAAKNRQATEIGMDTDLIKKGVLDSLQMVNFILYIEEIRGKEIPETLIRPENFFSLRVIFDTFFHQ